MKTRYEAPEFELLKFVLEDRICFNDSFFDVEGEFGDYETEPDEGGDDI